MMRSLMSAPLSLVLFGLALGACDDESGDDATPVAAIDFDDQDCAACGMIVRDQPSPRAQLVHADGERVYFCAISDLVAYAAAPSPHGDHAAIFVEVMPADADPADLDKAKRPWRLVEDVTFVTGSFERPVMGRPVLTFEDEAAGGAAATRLSAEAMDWDALRATLSEENSGHAH